MSINYPDLKKNVFLDIIFGSLTGTMAQLGI